MTGAELKPFALFAELADAERDELAELLEERDLSNGETLFEEGDDSDALVLVLSGRVEVSSRRRRDPLSIGPGGSFGAVSLFTFGTRAATVVGAESSDLRLLRREEFLRFADDHPRPAFRIAAAVAAEVAEHARMAVSDSVDPAHPGE
jgi:CRP-like cAMP-binding protein